MQFILLKIIRRHHGNLTNFFFDRNGKRPQIGLDNSDVEYFEKQLSVLNFEAYQAILDSQNLKTAFLSWSKLKKRFTSRIEIDDVKMELEEKKTVKYFFLQHYLFSLLLSADKGDMMLSGELKRDLSFLKNHLLPHDIISDFKRKKHKDDKPRSIDETREEAYFMVAENAQKYRDKAFFSITLPTGLGKTYAAYNAAVILQNAFSEQTGQVPRIVYVLPFTPSVFDIISRKIDSFWSIMDVKGST